MDNPTPPLRADSARPAQAFPTTHWTTLLVPIRERAAGASAALERLLEIYRAPLVTHARRLLREQDQAEAEDVVHDFIVTLLRREDLVKVRRESGKFRSFLAAGLRNHVVNFIHARNAAKRGGGAAHVALEEMVFEPADFTTAETEFHRRWTEASVAEVVRRLELEWLTAGKAGEFADLRELALANKGPVTREELAVKYGVTLNAVDAKVSRLRRRFREEFRALILQTVSHPGEVEEEMRFLLGIMSR